MNAQAPTVLAFSGGLDTTWCAVWLREQGHAVHAVTVQTGGFDTRELGQIEQRARQARVADWRLIDGRAELFRDLLRYLIYANALRGGVYPLCVAAERVVQARLCAEHARRVRAQALAHGSTGAGNDQIRFDVGFRVFAPELPVLAPVREQSVSRDRAARYLAERGIEIPQRTTRYSFNRGLWGTTIGGAETLTSEGLLPEEAWCLTAPQGQRPADPEEVNITFERGVPTALDDHAHDPVRLIETLNQRAGRHGVGRGMHLGDTILGIKGRVAFEAPAALTLITAHRELEKLVLSRQQLFWKQTLGELYGAAVHEARYFDPLMRDLEAFLESSQRRVTGRVRVQWLAGQVRVQGVTSPWSLMDAELARYGESSTLWSGVEAAGFSRLYGLADWLHARIAQRTEQAGGETL